MNYVNRNVFYDVVYVFPSSIFKYRHNIYNSPFITHEDDHFVKKKQKNKTKLHLS